jgi:hypothetical protein
VLEHERFNLRRGGLSVIPYIVVGPRASDKPRMAREAVQNRGEYGVTGRPGEAARGAAEVPHELPRLPRACATSRDHPVRLFRHPTRRATRRCRHDACRSLPQPVSANAALTSRSVAAARIANPQRRVARGAHHVHRGARPIAAVDAGAKDPNHGRRSRRARAQRRARESAPDVEKEQRARQCSLPCNGEADARRGRASLPRVSARTLYRPRNRERIWVRRSH